MKYRLLLLISLFFTITNCVAMHAEIDWTSKYKTYAQRRCDAFSGTEREMLKSLSDIAVQKKNPKRYELVAQCLKEIYEYSKQSKKELTFLGCSISLLDPSNTFHRDLDQKNTLLVDILEQINYRVEDGPSEEDTDV